MSGRPYFPQPTRDENLDDTFGDEMIDPNEDWVPDQEVAANMEKQLEKTRREVAKASASKGSHTKAGADWNKSGTGKIQNQPPKPASIPTVPSNQPTSGHSNFRDFSQHRDTFGAPHDYGNVFGGGFSQPTDWMSMMMSGDGGKSRRSSNTYFEDDDVETLLALNTSDLLRSSMPEEPDYDDVLDMANLLRSAMVDHASHPPGLDSRGTSSQHHQSSLNSLGFGTNQYGSSQNTQQQQAQGRSMPPGLTPQPIGPPARSNAQQGQIQQIQQPHANSNQPANNNNQQNLVPRPPELTAEQLATLTPEELSRIEQWNLLYQQQSLRALQEQHQQQQLIMIAQHQQMLEQQEKEMLKRKQQNGGKDISMKGDEDSESVEGSQADDEEFDEASGSTTDTPTKATKRGKWAGKGTARMSPYEIDMIIRAQEYQVATSNPFLDDYYNQNVRILLNPNTHATHRPICDVAPPKKRPVDPTKKDPFAGCLGRISSGSSRAPRIMVVVENVTENSNDNKNNNPKEQEKNGIWEAKLNTLAKPGGIVLPDERRVMLAIENAYVILLELEDLKQLQHLHVQAGAAGHTVNQLQIQQLGQMIVEHLTQVISLIGIPKVDSPQAQSNHPDYAQWEKFLLAILRIPKGSRMFARLLPLLPAHSSVSVLKVLARNLTTIAALSLEPEQASLVNIADYLRRVLMQAELDFVEPLAECIIHNSKELLSNISAVLSTKAGCHVLGALMNRAHELKTRPELLQHPRLIPFITQYVAFHTSVLDSLKGKLLPLLTNAKSSMAAYKANEKAPPAPEFGVTTVAPPKAPKSATRSISRSRKVVPIASESAVWEFLFYLTLSSTASSKKTIHSELASQLAVDSIVANTSMDIINLKTTFTGILAQQLDPGFDELISRAKMAPPMPTTQNQPPHYDSMNSKHQHHSHGQPRFATASPPGMQSVPPQSSPSKPKHPVPYMPMFPPNMYGRPPPMMMVPPPGMAPPGHMMPPVMFPPNMMMVPFPGMPAPPNANQSPQTNGGASILQALDGGK